MTKTATKMRLQSLGALPRPCMPPACFGTATADFMRANRIAQRTEQSPLPLEVYGHMPFVGHRSVKQIWDRQDADIRKNMASRAARAAAYGFNPENGQ